MNKRALFGSVIFLTLLLLILSGCHTSPTDNSPSDYIPNGSAGSSSYDTTGMPIFSHTPGVYQDALVVSLSCVNPDYTIHYTTDCSLPTASSPVYTEPFPMQYDTASKNCDVTVFNIRAASFDKNGNQIGRIVNASYLFPSEADRFSTKIISLVTDPTNLYGNSGILDNPHNRGREWERPVNFQLYDVSGALTIQQDLGMRINGTGSRSNAQKNFRLFARKEYTSETGRLNLPLFPGLLSEYTGAQIEEYDTFLVRGGASNLHNSMITNLIAYELMEGSAVDAGNFEPATLFLNGKYYGIMMILEDYSPHYFESHYGVDENKISTINFTVTQSMGLNWEKDDCTEEEYQEWRSIVKYIASTDFSKPAEYERLCKMIDIDNMIDYIVFECYLDNWDWPRNNQRIWRYNGASGSSFTGTSGVGGYDPDAEYGFDGRWRFVAKDLDVSMSVNVDPNRGYHSPLDTYFFDVMRKNRGAENYMYDMFKAMMTNEDFCRRFYLCVCEFMSTRFSTENILDTINRLSLLISDEMAYHTAFYASVAPFGDSLTIWNNHLESMRTFAKLRPAYVVEDINDYSDSYRHGYTMSSFKLSVADGGSVDYNGGIFNGVQSVYTLKNQKIALTPLPGAGYKVKAVSVTGGSYDAGTGMLTVSSDSCTVTVTFEPNTEGTQKAPHTNLVINEVGHSSIEKVNGYDWIELYNPTDSEISLEGYSISNGIATYTFPSIKVPAGGFKVIFCSGTNDGGVYAPFTIASGDTVTIYNNNSEMLDSVAVLTKASTTHLGRYPDGGEWVELSRYAITPNAANSFTDGFEHEYSEKVKNTIMIKGVLADASLFACNEQGHLTITPNNVSKITGLSRADLILIIDLFANYDRMTPVDIAEWYETVKDNSAFDIYYVASLNSYVVHF